MFLEIERLVEAKLLAENKPGGWLEIPNLDTPLYESIQRGDQGEHGTQAHPLLCITTGFFNNYEDLGAQVNFEPIVYLTAYEIDPDPDVARDNLLARLWHVYPGGGSRGVLPCLMQRPYPRGESGQSFLFKVFGPPIVVFLEEEAGYSTCAARIPILAQTYTGVPTKHPG